MRPGRGLAGLLAACLGLWAGASGAEERPAAPDPSNLLDRLGAAWSARDVDAYLALWTFDDEAAREAERAFALARLGSGRVEIHVQRPAAYPSGRDRLGIGVQTFSASEPRARFEQWAFVVQRRAQAWSIVERESRGGVEGLVHLSLDPDGYRADGLSFRFEDFELQMHHGTLFGSPKLVGPTAFVFVGEGTVRFRPAPATEREQLRLFAGRPELVERVQTAFVRIHPADLHRVLEPVRLEADPHASKRLRVAEGWFREQVGHAFVLDASLPGSPWWLLPDLGDSLVTFRTAHRGTLSFAINAGDPEGISLFDRSRRRQICRYPAGGGSADYDEDEARAVDVTHHDLRVRFEPDQYRIQGSDTLSLRLLAPAPWIRLRLDDSLEVQSVTSTAAGSHVFFRVRNQDSVMVSLGPWSNALSEITLEVRYAGTLRPGPVESEALQRPPGPSPGSYGPDIGGGLSAEAMNIEKVLVYSNRRAWYPQSGFDDHATADMQFDVPAGQTVVTGGERLQDRTEGQRSLVRYSQKLPGRYISVAVGRLQAVERRGEAQPELQGFGVARTRGEVGEALDRAREILDFYSAEFGPCPYPRLALVLIEGLTPGGHSPPGMMLVARRPPLLRSSLVDDPGNFSDVPGFFLAHELAHQWWGHGVAGKNYHERWLSEAFAQYAAASWVRRSRGEKAFRGLLGRFADWAFRDNAAGPISLGSRLGRVNDRPRTFRSVVYDKGACVLHMLRGVVGDDAFRRGLQQLQQTYRFRKAGTSELRQALEAASGKDLGPYFQRWVYETTLPRLRVSHRSLRAPRTQALVEVKAQGLPGPVPLQVEVRCEGDPDHVTRRVELPAAGGVFHIDTPGRVRGVEVNADAGLLARVEG